MSRAKSPMIAAAFLLLAMTASLISQQRAGANDAAAKPRPTQVLSWEGSYCKIEKAELLRITNQEDWKSLWQRHHGDQIENDSFGQPVVPEIDFDRFMVIAIYGGKSGNTRSEGIDAIDDLGDALRVRFDARTYQTLDESRTYTLKPGETQEQLTKRMLEESERGAAADARNRTTPYGIFVVAKSNKMLIMEENVQGLLGAAPIWKERVRFEAIGK